MHRRKGPSGGPPGNTNSIFNNTTRRQSFGVPGAAPSNLIEFDDDSSFNNSNDNMAVTSFLLPPGSSTHSNQLRPNTINFSTQEGDQIQPVYSNIPQNLYFQLNSDEHLDLNALTLMEQVVLLGLKDKQVLNIFSLSTKFIHV